MLRLLDERRRSLLRTRGKIVNQLHALLRELIAGGVPADLDWKAAQIALNSCRPGTASDQMRKSIALDLEKDLRRVTVQLDENAERIEEQLRTCGTHVTEVFGVGPITAGRILARTGNPHRFPSEAAFAAYTGSAPVQVASADNNRHRLSRGGDRVINSALHVIAISQARSSGSPGHAYVQRKLAEGKTSREAIRCLKRQIAKKIWRIMCADAQRAALVATP